MTCSVFSDQILPISVFSLQRVNDGQGSKFANMGEPEISNDKTLKFAQTSQDWSVIIATQSGSGKECY